MSITLAQLKLECRQRADMENSQFVKDAELIGYINNSISELHDILIQAYDGDYYINEETFTTSGSAKQYDLSTIITSNDFYKLRGVDAKLNGNEWFTLHPFNFNERNSDQRTGNTYGISKTKYRLVGSKLTFTPAPDDNVEVKIWYIPTAQVLVNDTDSYDDINNFSEYVIVDAAIKMLNKEESDVSVLENQKKALKRRIEEAANNREVGQGDSVSDIYKENAYTNGFYGIISWVSLKKLQQKM